MRPIALSLHIRQGGKRKQTERQQEAALFYFLFASIFGEHYIEQEFFGERPTNGFFFFPFKLFSALGDES